MNYAATDPLSRWTGLGRPLHALEVDYNFYNHETRIATLEASVTATVSIANITQPTASSMLITMSNAASYTIALPTSTFDDRGAWLPLEAYFVNDTFTANGSLYRVLVDHTSAASFSPTANDGAGHDYYAAMMSNPGNALPTGGATGMMLKKSSSTDFAVSWGFALPNGGTAGQVLAKINSTDQNFAWTTLNATKVSFSPSTSSGLTSTNVAAALEELESLIASGALSGMSDVHFATGDPATGSILYYGATKWTASAAPSNGDLLVWNSGPGAWAPVAPATAADFRSNASGKMLTTDKVWSAADLVVLTDAATIAIDMATFINASVTLAGSRTLGNPSNTKNGQTGLIKIVQDATGSRTLAYASNWKFASGTAPTLTTAANAVDLLFYQVISSTFIYATVVKDVR